MILTNSLENIELISKFILEGKVVSFPTDTLFALSCDATNTQAIENIFTIKSRETIKSLPIFFKNLDQLSEHVDINNTARALINKYWPGALTLILPIKKNSTISELTHNNKNTLAVRIPGNQITQKILQLTNKPLVGTSANLSGQPNLLSAEAIATNLGKQLAAILSSSEPLPSDVQPSTIIDCSTNQPKIIRQGIIFISELDNLAAS
jgi:L-threonylcarbamoyladenylate synthase